jgi:hypothetical protein
MVQAHIRNNSKDVQTWHDVATWKNHDFCLTIFSTDTPHARTGRKKEAAQWTQRYLSAS